jgi:hypothetical protein
MVKTSKVLSRFVTDVTKGVTLVNFMPRDGHETVTVNARIILFSYYKKECKNVEILQQVHFYVVNRCFHRKKWTIFRFLKKLNDNFMIYWTFSRSFQNLSVL